MYDKILLCLFMKTSTSFCDSPQKLQLGIQDPSSPSIEGMINFHDYLLLFLIIIGVAVCFVLIKILLNFNSFTNKKVLNFNHSSLLEIVWTLVPAIILLFVAAPSFSLLYSLDELIDPSLTLKIVGHQWYWSYELLNSVTGDTLNFDSYILNVSDLKLGTFRLLEVDNRVILPVKTHIRLLVTAADVLHSWAVPSFGLKIDACPGRLSHASLFLKRAGVYYGQCSEICGINHGFMPIVVKGVTINRYLSWVFSKV